MLNVVLFTKEGCGLCDGVRSELERLAKAYPYRLIEIDITKDATLLNRYRYIIPVVQIGRIELKAPITPIGLETALATILTDSDVRKEN